MESSTLTLVPRDQPILTYWRLPHPDGHTLVCTSYRTHAGLELRAGLEGDCPVLQAVVATHAEAHRLAEVWKKKIARSPAA
jgi:hypothetical protein